MKAESKKKLIKQVFFICPDTRWYSSQCFWNRKSNGAISHPCPIHPNWVDLCEALYDSTRFAQCRSTASICSTGSQDPWNTGNHDTWTFLVLKTWQETSVDLYEALYDSIRTELRLSQIDFRHDKSTTGETICVDSIESTTVSTHPA